MSLAIVAFDAKQSLVVTDGITYLLRNGKRELFRDDLCKACDLGPRLAMATTGAGGWGLMAPVSEFARAQAQNPNVFESVVGFTQGLLDRHPHLACDVAAVIFGWCPRSERMRCAVWCADTRTFQEVCQLDDKPGFVAIGDTPGLGLREFLSERIGKDPFKVLEEAVTLAESKDPYIGGRHFGMIYQAPEPWLSREHASQVWPVMEIPARTDTANKALAAAAEEIKRMVAQNGAAPSPAAETFNDGWKPLSACVRTPKESTSGDNIANRN